MKLTFVGAAKTVTGSCYLVETAKCKILVDCGMFQGKANEDNLNAQPFVFKPAEIDYLLLTHAHIDHTGRIPKLYNEGFKGSVIGTKATVELCRIMLPDSGHIQETEADWTNRKALRAGRPPVKPLYTFQDAVDCLKLFKSVQYSEILNITNEIRVRFNDAGHILGSSILELWVNENGEETKIVFSGDIGNKGTPILKDPSIIESADYLLIESTYGNRLHTDKKDKLERFINIAAETIEKGGNLVIPSFAVGRTQEIIYDLHHQRGKYGDKLKKLFNVPVFIDSPLAVSATEVFRNNLDCYDDEAREYISNGDNPLDFPGLQFTRTAEESKALNERDESMIIISASGMCEAGRIKHHLKHNLWRENSTVLFIGYQAEGTLGRKLVEGASKVKLFGEEITVKARVEMIDGFSGHADKDGLIEWLDGFKTKPKNIFIVHGEEEAMKEFSKTISDRYGIETIIPSRNDTVTLKAGKAAETLERPVVGFAYRRLALLDLIATLKEEFEELSNIVSEDLKKEKEDYEVDALNKKLLNLERAIVEALK